MRCTWADSNELLVPYHDEEWGVPVHDDRLLFEMLTSHLILRRAHPGDVAPVEIRVFGADESPVYRLERADHMRKSAALG